MSVACYADCVQDRPDSLKKISQPTGVSRKVYGGVYADIMSEFSRNKHECTTCFLQNKVQLERC